MSRGAADSAAVTGGAEVDSTSGEESNPQLRGSGNFQTNSLALILTHFPSEQ